ncbi:MAG TPA: SDR family NAD(P)-dependent oxidoreductase [Myxococcales bacterium]|nr:SDR family NAD(P)-dependent oxidoreductase [Myxococcales bacterium]
MELKGIGAVVTGGSRGLGRALARELAAAGARVLLTARGEAELARAVDEIRAAGGDAHGFPADVSDKLATHAVAAAAASLVGPAGLLVNNASTLGTDRLALLLDTPCEAIERALAVNVVGPFRLIKAVAGGMALRRQGLVVNVTSDAGLNAYPRWGAYGLSKAAFEHLSRTLAVELAGSGVAVTCVDPGDMDTQMHRDAVPDADPATLLRPEAVARELVQRIRAPGPLPARFQLWESP